MSRAFRGVLVAVTSLALALSLVSPSAAARADGVGAQGREFTPAQARDVLARAQRMLRRPDAARSGQAQRVPARGTAGHEADLTLVLRDLFLARPALTGSDRSQADALLARPSDPRGDDLGFGTPVSYDGVAPENRKSHCPEGGVACVHWVTSGRERIGSDADADGNGVPDYVETVYATIANVWTVETTTLGYRPPLPDDGAPEKSGNPDSRLDIYLADVGSRGLFGYCAPDGANRTSRSQPGYCVLDNDYASSQFRAAPLRSLQVTAAHEFFHAVQFAYDVAEDVWFMEGTATWMEDQVYDHINDNYRYLPFSAIRRPRAPLDTESGFAPYGAFLFFTFATEQRGAGVVRRFWDVAASPARSLAAIRSVVGTSAWPGFFALFTSWNTLPPRSYSERASYPDPAWWQRRVLTRRNAGLRSRSVALPHLASASVLLQPGPRLTRRARLVVDVDGPSANPGMTVLVQRRLASGAVTHTLVRTNRRGDVRIRLGLDRRSVRAVVVVLSNTNPGGSARNVRLRATVR